MAVLALRRKWVVVAIAVPVIVAVVLVTVWVRRPSTHVEPMLPPRPEAPPDLEKLRDKYAAAASAPLDRALAEVGCLEGLRAN